MKSANNKTFGADLFKSIGHEAITLLNSIAGPVELIRAYSDDSRLIDPLKILELSAYRFEKFSLRALLITDILSKSGSFEEKEVDIVDCLKHIALELDDFSNFYRIKFNIADLNESIYGVGNLNLIYQCFQVIMEQSLQLSAQDSTIAIKPNLSLNNSISISISDNGFLTKKFNEIKDSPNLPNEIDFAFFVLASDNIKNLNFSFAVVNNNSEMNISVKNL